MNRSDIQWWCGYLAALQDLMRYIDETTFDHIMDVINRITRKAVYDIVKEAQHEQSGEATGKKAGK